MKLYTKELKSLEEHNSKDSNWNRHIYDRSPRPNGIACPNCGKELMDTNPIYTLLSIPSKKNINCPSCDYVGYRIA